jgi:hypothetical protein
MKTNNNNGRGEELNQWNELNGLNRERTDGGLKQLQTHSFTARCVASCRKLLAHIQKAKAVIEAEFRDAFGVPEPMLHLALNEAEALAWQTEYPYLVFPALAMEKAQAVAKWQVRQRAIWGGGRQYAFAA